MKLDSRIERLEAKRRSQAINKDEQVPLSEEAQKEKLKWLREKFDQVKREHEEEQKLPLDVQLAKARAELERRRAVLVEIQNSVGKPRKKGDAIDPLNRTQIGVIFSEHLVRNLEERIKKSSIQLSEEPEGSSRSKI